MGNVCVCLSKDKSKAEKMGNITRKKPSVTFDENNKVVIPKLDLSQIPDFDTRNKPHMQLLQNLG
jgi:hypothetical protein